MRNNPVFLLLLAAPAAVCQQMPYTLAYVYTATAVNGLTVSATTVANTYGISGHTAAASVRLTSPDNRTASANMYHSYMSQATVYLSMCSGDVCYDGTYFASSKGTQEYCPITNVYLEDPEQQDQKQVAGFVYLSETNPVQFISMNDPPVPQTQIQRRNGNTRLRVKAERSPSCNAAGVAIQATFSSDPGGISYGAPPIQPAPTIEFVGGALSGQGFWTVTTNSNNNSSGSINVDAYIATPVGGACENKGATPKGAQITVL